ncbi:MAG: carboxymuconolactone decarboxylase family protein [Rhizomicrobium sp.]
MSKSVPRIPPLKRSEWTDEARDVFAVMGGAEAWEQGPPYGIISIFAQHPSLTRPFLTYARHLLTKSILPDRVRELIVLYVGWTCKSEYEWASHLREGLRSGAINAADIDAIKQGPDSSHWSDSERALLRAVDQMRSSYSLDDEMWAALAEQFDHRQMMELVFAIGTYMMLSMVTNSLRIPLEGGAEGEELAKLYGTP